MSSVMRAKQGAAVTPISPTCLVVQGQGQQEVGLCSRPQEAAHDEVQRAGCGGHHSNEGAVGADVRALIHQRARACLILPEPPARLLCWHLVREWAGQGGTGGQAQRTGQEHLRL